MSAHPVKLRRKNQMTLPAKVSEDMGVDEGDTIYVQKEGDRYILITSDEFVDPTAGALEKYARGKPPVTQENMDKAVEDGILDSWNRFVREIESEYDK